MRAKISIAFLSISLIVSFGLTSNQAFAGFDFPFPESCQDCDELEQLFLRECTNGITSQSQIVDCKQLAQVLSTCAADFCRAIGGEFIPIDATAVLIAGIQTNALSVLSAFVVIGAIAFGALVFQLKENKIK